MLDNNSTTSNAIYLFDCMFATKTATNFQKLKGLFTLSYEYIYSQYIKGKPVRGKRWYVIDSSTSESTLKKYISDFEIRDEVWKEIPDCNDSCMISSYGRLKDANGRPILPLFKRGSSSKEQRYVRLNIKGNTRLYPIGVLVANTFLGVPKEKGLGSRIYHKNGIQYDDYFGNLCYSSIGLFNEYNHKKPLGLYGDIKSIADVTGESPEDIKKALSNNSVLTSKGYVVKYVLLKTRLTA